MQNSLGGGGANPFSAIRLYIRYESSSTVNMSSECTFLHGNSLREAA